jgi:CubicO group peptidase (beta-lactamase class C family)
MRNRLLALITAIVVAIAGLAADAQQSPAADRLEKLIRDRVDSGMAMGLVVGILAADGTRRIAAYGAAGPGAKPLTEKSIFEIGSITKVFTGTLLAEMAASGMLAVDDPAQKHAPDMMRLPTRGEKQITLLDLSTHHSGLPRLPDNLAPKDPANPYVDYTLERLNAFLQGHTLTRDVGATFEYSNLGTGLLGAILANRAGTDYESLVRERILSPLGMTMTGVQVSPAMASESAIGHNAAGAPVPPWVSGVLVGAGGLRSNVDDMLKFLDANIGPPKSALERAMRTAHEPRRDAGGIRIGLNWLIRTMSQDRIVWHNGGTGGFRTFIGFDPERQIGAVVLSNSAQGVDDIGFHLINAAVPLLPTPVQLAPEKLRRYAGVYELAPEFRIDVTVEGGRIYIQATKQPRFEILPQSETEFFVRAFEARITFVVEHGETTALILRQGGVDQRARRLR